MIDKITMQTEFIPFNRPSISEAECLEVLDTLKSLWLTTGPKTKRFEEEFCKVTGATTALALNSCTAGLHLGLKALGVGPGDEVITTPLTFCATANVIEHLGATTVLADIDPKTWLIDPQKIKEKITARTKVLLPVHFAGQMADMTTINSLAKEHDLAVLEDCAHCLPNSYEDGRFVGNTENLCSFSFYANKNITTGEGGMLTGPAKLIEHTRALSLHGMDRDAWKRFEKGGSWRYDVAEPGFKYNMTDMQAALGLVQLSRMEDLFQSRKDKAHTYQEAFSNLNGLQMPLTNEHSSFHIFPIVIDPQITGFKRDAFIDALKQANIGTSVHYLPLHYFTYYSKKYGWQPQDFPHASFIGENCLTLPLYPSLSHEEQTYIIETVVKLLRKA